MAALWAKRPSVPSGRRGQEKTHGPAKAQPLADVLGGFKALNWRALSAAAADGAGRWDRRKAQAGLWAPQGTKRSTARLTVNGGL